MRPSPESPVHSLNLTHLLSPPPPLLSGRRRRRKPVEAQTVHFRFPRPPLLDAHWPASRPAAPPLAERGGCPDSRQQRTPRGVIGQFRSLKSRQNGTSFALGVFPCARDYRELLGRIYFPGRDSNMFDNGGHSVRGTSLSKLWSSRRAAPCSIPTSPRRNSSITPQTCSPPLPLSALM